jgi:predicted nucleotidyltransferase
LFDFLALLYIFGSFTKEENYRDIDIALYLNENESYKDLKKYPFGYQSIICGELSLILQRDDLDIVVLNSSGLLLFNQVISSGEIIIDRDKLKRVKIENRVRGEYIDTAFLRSIKDRYLIQFIGNRNLR